MTTVGRSIALTIVLSLAFYGPLAPFAVAQQPAPASSPAESGTTAYDVGAGIANVVHVPGKAILCGLGVLAGSLLLVITFGSGYKPATAAAEEGCGGKWVLNGDDLRPMRITEDMERARY